METASIEAPPVIVTRPKRRVMATWAIGAALLIAAGATLYLFEPTQHRFYPRCLLHEYTGLACPGCGALRAVHQLLRGHFSAAFQLNPLLMLVLPAAAWRAVGTFSRAWRGLPPRAIFPTPFWGWLALGVVIVFTIARNLPFFPFPKV
jgi:hypothetical protein